MSASDSRGIVNFMHISDEDDAVGEQYQVRQNDVDHCVRAVENLLNYRFRNRKLLEEALTHSSYTGSASYQRLEFVGDAALGLAFANFVYLAYPSLDPGQLSLIRSANISTENLARVAVRHGLYRYVRHNAAALHEKVTEFVLAVQEEDMTIVYGGRVKAPKVLADIVESVAAAVYVDCDFDLKALWQVFRRLLEPVVTLDILQQQPQPVTELFELCQKKKKQVDIKHWKRDTGNVTSVFVDGKLIASNTSDRKETSKLIAAREALSKLTQANMISNDGAEISCEVNAMNEIEAAKQKLNEICDKKKWHKPSYRIVEEAGPAHGKRFKCSVQVETPGAILVMTGDEKPRLRDAENSAASLMIYSLSESDYL
ncbi:hypothetical protein Nepgr_026199 [Nepenthes gracilis]|uniref:Uncharacterized protein n=1 Tax=Nepenthes gracilis TaxID=150966 RepID=A0AAD3T869_NEPGR|nr:hypothetical protein Nepgr_026199 [Nepenthes gracilis]